MPLRDGAVDFAAWHFDSKGVFSVRQAYKLKRALSEAGDGGAGDPQSEAGKQPEWGWAGEVEKNMVHVLSGENQTLHVKDGAQYPSNQGYIMQKGHEH